MTPFTNQILRTLRQKERSTIHLHRPERVHAHGKPISRANLRMYQRLPYYLIRFIPHYILPVIPFHIVIPLIYRADLWCSVRLAVVRKWVFGGAKELFFRLFISSASQKKRVSVGLSELISRYRLARCRQAAENWFITDSILRWFQVMITGGIVHSAWSNFLCSVFPISYIFCSVTFNFDFFSLLID